MRRFQSLSRNGGGDRLRPDRLLAIGAALVFASCVAREERVSGAPISATPAPPAAAVPAATPAPAPAAPAPAPDPVATPGPAAAATDDAAFAANIQPILFRTCAPCHKPGGIMYERMPFDDPRVIREHRAGVLRRLKGPDHDAVAAWLGDGQ